MLFLGSNRRDCMHIPYPASHNVVQVHHSVVRVGVVYTTEYTKDVVVYDTTVVVVIGHAGLQDDAWMHIYGHDMNKLRKTQI